MLPVLSLTDAVSVTEAAQSRLPVDPLTSMLSKVKLPGMLRKKFGNDLSITVVSGNDFPDNLKEYDLVIHCGACMFTKRHVMARVNQAMEQGVPITNYGIAIATLSGIIDKVVY